MNSSENDLNGLNNPQIAADIEAYNRGKAQGTREGHWLGMAIVKDYALQEKEYEATHDPLTGLNNRAGLNEYLAKNAVADSVFLFVDLTNFKRINDELSHDDGDRALIGIAGVLRDAVREEDFIARIGGDEFIIIFAPTRHVSKDKSRSASELLTPEEQVPIVEERIAGGVEKFLEDNPDLQGHGLDAAVGASLAQPGDNISRIKEAEKEMKVKKIKQHAIHGAYR